jgi:outer membrane protein assembly factor BamA
LTSVYYAGGYRILRGYDYKEFSGDALIYNGFTYHVPIVERPPEKILGIPLSIVTFNLFLESAKIGGREIYETAYDVKFSAGAGIGYRVVLLDRFPVQLELSAAKAFDSRSPQFYFTLSTIYYTWKNE